MDDTFSTLEQQAVSQESIEGTNNTTINDAALSIARARELEERYEEERLPDGFFYNREGLYYQPHGKGDDDDPPPIFISSKLSITACTRDDNNENHGRLLEFKDVDDHHHEWAMPCAELGGDGTHYREELLSKGLRIAPGAKARHLLTQFIQSAKPKARARCVLQTGWHKKCFVLPDQVIGDSGKERIILQQSSPNSLNYTVSGSLNEWRDNVSSLCIGNNCLIFSVSIAFAAPLLQLLDIESGGIHFRGSSSCGKTTALYAAASIWGDKSYVQRWRATTNGIEALAAGHNDTLLCLDELQQVDPYMAGEVAYMLANGAGKARADRLGYSRKKATWRLLFLSTGEISLSEHLKEAGKKVRAGQEVRIVDIPADIHKFGVFEDLHGYANGSAFSDALSEACYRYHGVPSREFLKKIKEQRDDIKQTIEKFSDEFLHAYVNKSADGQVYRVAKRFALIAAAGELATMFGITGWAKGDALAAARSCFFDWLNNRGGEGSQEEQAILSQVKFFFEQHGESRFTPWDADPEYKTVQRAGFRQENDNGEIEFLVFPETFKTEIAKGYDKTVISKICAKHGLLRLGSKGEFTRSERLPNTAKNSRCYRFTSKVLGDEDTNVQSDLNSQAH